jgi:hypothetical protein
MKTKLCLLTLPLLLSATVVTAQQNQYDSRIESYVGLRYVCDGVVQPVLRIQNVGGETMTSCDIDILKNGFTNSTFNWVLANPAAPGQTRQPVLPVVSGVLQGDVLEFRILTVNGQPDQGPVENILQVPMTDEKGTADSYQVQVKVLTDENPEETSWRIKDALGNTVAQSPAYTEAGTVFTTSLTITADQCYNFEVLDGGGDGFGVARELGYAKLLSLGSEVAAVSGDFASLYRKGVQTGTEAGCVPSALTATPDPAVSCGANGLVLGSSVIHATEVPGANKYRFRFTNIPGQPAYARNIASTSRSLTLGNWATLPLKRGRTYNVQVQGSFDNGSTWCPFGTSCTIRIGYGVAGDEQRMFEVEGDEPMSSVFNIFPNPSTDGSLNITVSGFDEEAPVTMEVHDLIGSRVASVFLGPVSDGSTTPVMLPQPLARGIYLVHMRAGDHTATQRLVVQ